MRKFYITNRRWFWRAGIIMYVAAVAAQRMLGYAEWQARLLLFAGVLLVTDGFLMASNLRGLTENYVTDRRRFNPHARSVRIHRLNGLFAIISGLVLTILGVIVLWG